MVGNTQKLLHDLVEGQKTLTCGLEKLTKEQKSLVEGQVNLADGQNLIRDDIKDLKKRVNEIDTNLTGRINKLGLQLANLEDDSPTIEEFDNLEKRVSVVEQKLVFN